jgi:heterodisulfide reductase subunit B
MKMNYGYFLGCVMPAKMPWAEKATFLVAKHLNLPFDYLKGTLCCIRPGVWKAINPDWWLLLTSQNLALAEKQGVSIVDSCNGCYISHYECLEEIKNNSQKLLMVNNYLEKIGLKIELKVDVKHFLEILYENLDKIKKNIVRPIKIKAIRHLGCHGRKHGEKLPNYFDEIIKSLGIEIIDTPYDRMCCGLLLYLSDPYTSVYRRAGLKLEYIEKSDADCLIFICSGCYDQFDRVVRIYKDEKRIEFKKPIIHLSELLALSFGYKPEDFGMMYYRPISPINLINKVIS